MQPTAGGVSRDGKAAVDFELSGERGTTPACATPAESRGRDFEQSQQRAAHSRRQRAGALWLRFGVACLTPVFGMAWALFDPERRALYDIAAKTAFVRLQPPPEG